MNLKDVAHNFHHTIISLESERVELFQKEKIYNNVKVKADSAEDKLNLVNLNNEISELKRLFEDRQKEKAQIGGDLYEMLLEANIKPNEKIEYHVTDNSYFDIWYLEDGEVCATIGLYSKI